MGPSTAVCKGTSCAYSHRRQICKLLKCSGICIWHCAVPSVCAHLRFVDNAGRGSGSGDRRYGIGTCSNRVAPASFSEQTYLASMYIEDFVLVRKQSVRFGTGMNVISGQSGSGKSVLLNAFNVVLGMQASSDMVRSPADVAGKVSFAGMICFGARAHNIQRVHTNFRWRTGAIVGSAQRDMGSNYAVVHDNVWYGVVQTTKLHFFHIFAQPHVEGSDWTFMLQSLKAHSYCQLKQVTQCHSFYWAWVCHLHCCQIQGMARSASGGRFTLSKVHQMTASPAQVYLSTCQI
jgi:energy-coupling factor transporter ATP-binding protein EcfA2